MAYTAPPTLARFMRSPAFVRVAVGPIGSGKSSACVVEILRRSAEQAPDAAGVRRTRWAVVRNTYRELKDTTRKTFEQWIPPGTGEWHEQDFAFTIDRPLKDGTRLQTEVLFRALDRPQDVKKLLSLEITGCYFNELREIAKPVFDGMQGRAGRYPAKKDGGASWFGVWADSNPWHTGHWLHKLEKSKPDGFAFFHQPGGRSLEAENLENLPGGYYPRLCAGKDSEWIRVYADGEEASSDVGSIFGALIDKLGKRGGLAAFNHSKDDVFTNWDLGIADAMAIWIWQVNAHGVADIIDFYAGHGRPLSHYLNVLDAKPYKYIKHWLPHDARARTLTTGGSVLEQCLARWPGKVAIGPALSIADGLEAARWHLEQPMRIHARCDDPVLNESGGEEHPSGVEALREYRYEWDEENKVFSKKPLHNWASNPADAFRYVSCVVQASELLTRKPKPKSEPAFRAPNTFKLDELWETAPNRGGGGRI